jgi:glycosyltransferase involved in cell wall biosynthesis
MRIALDARSYFMRTGIARFTRGLVHSLVSGSSPHEWLLLISNHHTPEELPLRGARIRIRQSQAPWLGGAVERGVLQQEVETWGADLFHAVFPPHGLRSIPTVTTVFDCSPLSHPSLHQDPVKLAFADALDSARTHARGFVTTSDATREQLVQYVVSGRPGLSEVEGSRSGATGDDRPIWTIPCGLSAPFDQRPPAGDAANRSGVLFVGTIEPRKNVALLLSAIRRLAATGRRVPLTLIGKRGWGYPEFDADLARTPGARWLGYVDDHELLAHYRSAAIVALPSLLEGFGLPVLEAMSQGALPLVAPDGALRDLAGDPSLQVPLDPEAWSAAISRWLDNVPARQAMTSVTTDRAHRFTWSAAADACLEAYRVLETPQRTVTAHE